MPVRMILFDFLLPREKSIRSFREREDKWLMQPLPLFEKSLYSVTNTVSPSKREYSLLERKIKSRG